MRTYRACKGARGTSALPLLLQRLFLADITLCGVVVKPIRSYGDTASVKRIHALGALNMYMCPIMQQPAYAQLMVCLYCSTANL